MQLPENKILNILEKYNFKNLRKSTNGNYLSICPFHDHGKKSTPNFSINIRTGKWCCFSGQCGIYGGIVKLIMKLESCGYEDALKIIYEGSENIVYEMMLENLEFKEKVDEKKKSPKIWLNPVYLHSYNNWEEKIEKLNIKPWVTELADIKVSHNKYYKDKLIIPVFDEDRNILDYELRKWLLTDLEKKVLYLPNSKMSHWVYGFGIWDGETPSTAILVEGVKDVLTLIGYNYFALGLFGTKITKEKIRMMLSSGIKKIIVMLDDDAAGHEAQKKIVKECVNYFDTDEVFLPKGKDPNDFSENDFYFDVVDHNLVLNEAKLK